MRKQHRYSVARVLLVMLLACATSASTQSFDLDTHSEYVSSLNGLWHFHPGDDMRWAEKDFDDSQWALIRSDQSWTKQDYPHLSGYAWYRFQLRISDGSRPTALVFAPICTGYQVYIDGKLVSSFGSATPTANPVFPGLQIGPFDLPKAKAGPRTVQVALRVWEYSRFVSWLGGGPLSKRNFAGDPALLANQLVARQASSTVSLADNFAFLVLESLVGLTILTLFLFRREDREFLWFSLLILAEAADVFWHLVLNLGNLPFAPVRLAGEIAVAIELVSALLFFSIVLKVPRRFFWGLSFVAALISPLTIGLFYFHWTEIGTAYVILLLCRLPTYLWIVAALGTAVVRKDPTGRLLLAPSLLFFGSDALDLISFANRQYGSPFRLIDFNPLLIQTPFPFALNDLSEYLFTLALLLFLVRRFSLSKREESRLATEMAAARSIQFLSVPGAAEVTPGFEVDTVYLPATEVGGDFFRIHPGQSGSLLVVVGDVSGKGLKAAMTVSTIIGALRGCALQDPAAILTHLNEVLCGQISGFATCCVASISVDGTMTLANAGHLPPYLAGQELPIQSGLPLGLVADETYQNKEYEIAVQEQLLFLSDGVVEACNAAGELYGFDRTLHVSRQSAAAIAQAAKQFGQDDDITVVTIKRA